jgi:HEAT repeat protein
MERVPGNAAEPLVKLLEAEYCDDLFPWVEEALEKLTAPGAAQVAPLLGVIDRFLSQSQFPDATIWAATLLGRIGADAAPAVASLAGLLHKSEFPEVQAKAAWALGKIGTPARAATPHLKRAASNDSNTRLAELAQDALRKVNS